MDTAIGSTVTVTSSPKNRRASQRKPPRSTVRVECRRGSYGLGSNLLVSFLDLSEGGMRLVVKESFKMKEEVEVLLTSFGLRQPIKRAATVAWVLPLEGGGNYCIGVEFQKRLRHHEVLQFSRP